MIVFQTQKIERCTIAGVKLAIGELGKKVQIEKKEDVKFSIC